ncbi:MAG: hypothetical protein FJX76_06680 [Armatimonadetes bacterium]|nr:hypothetical protein [Armatimonadota bacterium]
MSDERLEVFLARLLVDEKARARFLANPRSVAEEFGLDSDLFGEVDRLGLELAAESCAAKRVRRSQRTVRT